MPPPGGEVPSSPAPPTAPAAPSLVPPQLLEAPPIAAYPEDARAQRLEAEVLLQLTIAVDGSVRDAVVTSSAGHGFDEAAREALLRARFSPATRSGRPVVARIAYRYAFTLPPAVGPEPDDIEEARAPKEDDPPSTAPLEPPIPTTTAPVIVPTPVPASTSERTPERAEVTVRGNPRDGQRLQRSAEAVNVIDTRKAHEQTVDLGEVMARTQGVSIRREGGLGSGARFSLNGLSDYQIRFFIDGVPLESSAYPSGLVDVPVNFFDRIEVYRGVVPIRFGADALGGAVNLVSDRTFRPRLGASYQTGSYGTYRLTANGAYRDDDTGLVVRGTAYLDRAKNDYDIDVGVGTPTGGTVSVTTPRFHDAYHAIGASLEAGVVDKAWAKQLTLEVFTSQYSKELQNNLVMTIPYGEARYGGSARGLTARYDVPLHRDVDLELLASFSRRTIDFTDLSNWVYDWYGHQVRPLSLPGEVDNRGGGDRTYADDAVYARGLATWRVAEGSTLRATVTPRFTSRKGVERTTAPGEDDPLRGDHKIFTFVSGVEYELDAIDHRLTNIVFAKDYVYSSHSEARVVNALVPRDVDHHEDGVGDSLRFRFTPWLYAKASYEYATRLPRAVEAFGDGVLIRENLQIEPEVSHNANLGPRVELRDESLGELTVDVNGFFRASDHLIALVIQDPTRASYQNVNRARGLGVEGSAAWVSPGRFVQLGGTATWQDVRNLSHDGIFGDYHGDRIPNSPYVFGSWGARFRFPGAPSVDDTIEPFYAGRYVHSFFRGWESAGNPIYKEFVDAQVTHSAGVSWIVPRPGARIISTFEIDNLTNAKVFDNFGLQKPGRAYYVKVTGEFL